MSVSFKPGASGVWVSSPGSRVTESEAGEPVLQDKVSGCLKSAITLPKVLKIGLVSGIRAQKNVQEPGKSTGGPWKH